MAPARGGGFPHRVRYAVCLRLHDGAGQAGDTRERALRSESGRGTQGFSLRGTIPSKGWGQCDTHKVPARSWLVRT